MRMNLKVKSLLGINIEISEFRTGASLQRKNESPGSEAFVGLLQDKCGFCAPYAGFVRKCGAISISLAPALRN